MRPIMKSLKDISLKSSDRSAIEETAFLLRGGFSILEIRLFGSKARGEDDPESDIDLLVLTPKRLSWQEREAMTNSLYDIQMKYDVVISLLVVPSDEWRTGMIAALPIHDEIEEEGIAA